MSHKSQWFKMPKADKFTLISLIVFTIVTFCFVKSDATISRLSVFGWLMGAFMFIAPIISISSMRFDNEKQQKEEQNGLNI